MLRRGVYGHSPLLPVDHKNIDRIAQGRTRQLRPLSLSVPNCALMELTFLTHTQWDALLGVALHRCHVCYCPLELQLLSTSQSKLSKGTPTNCSSRG